MSTALETTVGPRISVLDHGFVRLVDHMGGDLDIVRAARVSYDAAWRAGDDPGSDARLIRYLIKNHHTSPLEAVEFQFEVKAPIFVFRQWHRHRTWSYNELSARYRELPSEYYAPEIGSIGKQSKDNKQGRAVNSSDAVHEGVIRGMILAACEVSLQYYGELLDQGCPRELARGVLPLNTYSHMFAKVDLHNLFHFLELRLHAHAQYEIRVYAEAILKLITPIVPTAVAAWNERRLAQSLPEPSKTAG